MPSSFSNASSLSSLSIDLTFCFCPFARRGLLFLLLKKKKEKRPVFQRNSVPRNLDFSNGSRLSRNEDAKKRFPSSITIRGKAPSRFEMFHAFAEFSENRKERKVSMGIQHTKAFVSEQHSEQRGTLVKQGLVGF